MMNVRIEETVDVFAGTVKAALETMYSDGYSVTIQEVKKNNGMILHGVIIREEAINIAPTIYLDSYYEDYKNGCSFGGIINSIVATYESHKMDKDYDVENITSFEAVKDRICFKLINSAKNQELIKEIPHVSFMDMEIVFFILIKQEFDGVASVLIRNNMVELWGNPDIETIYELAKANTPRLFGGKVSSMLEVLGGLISDNEEFGSDPEGTFISMDLLEESTMPMYVATNRSKMNGAGVILYEGLLAEFARRIGGDFFILPSSCHEVIFLPANVGADVEYLVDMVRCVNQTEVSPDEILSDNVYKYIADEDRVEMM